MLCLRVRQLQEICMIEEVGASEVKASHRKRQALRLCFSLLGATAVGRKSWQPDTTIRIASDSGAGNLECRVKGS